MVPMKSQGFFKHGKRGRGFRENMTIEVDPRVTEYGKGLHQPLFLTMNRESLLKRCRKFPKARAGKGVNSLLEFPEEQ